MESTDGTITDSSDFGGSDWEDRPDRSKDHFFSEIEKEIVSTFGGKLRFLHFSDTFFQGSRYKARQWLVAHQDRFLQIVNAKRNVTFLTVYSEKAWVCFDYFRLKKCRRKRCMNFHVCKEHIFGKCSYEDRCIYNHDLLSDSHNRKLAKDYGFERMSNAELTTLVRFSNPVVCTEDCPKKCYTSCSRFHVCPNWVRFRCIDDDDMCDKPHHFDSWHSLQMLKQYQMESLEQDEAKRQIVVPTSQPRNQADDDTTSVATGAVSSAYSSDELGVNIIHADEIVQTICEENLRGKCDRGHQCTYHHLTLPYMWQEKVGSKWRCLFDLNERIEELYCRPEIDINEEIKIRRLSTKSYIESLVCETYATKWVWYWQNYEGEWFRYGQGTFLPLQHTLESNYTNCKMKFNLKLHSETQGSDFAFDLQSMIQTNCQTYQQHNISRRPVRLCNPDTEEPSEILPKHWSPLEPLRQFTTVQLCYDSEEFLRVKENFDASMKEKAVIKGIIRVQNPLLWQLYRNKKDILVKKLGYSQDLERTLFHGTKEPSTVTAICSGNFDCRNYGTHGINYGKGSYFATRASYSNMFTGRGRANEQLMFQAKVLVGKYTVGKPEYTRPPKVDESMPESDLYNSCVNKQNDPTIFVVFELDHCYPEYIITYVEHNATEGDVAFAYQPASSLRNGHRGKNLSTISVHTPYEQLAYVRDSGSGSSYISDYSPVTPVRATSNKLPDTKEQFRTLPYHPDKSKSPNFFSSTESIYMFTPTLSRKPSTSQDVSKHESTHSATSVSLGGIPTKFEQSNLSSSTESIYMFTPPLSRKREKSFTSQDVRKEESTHSSTSVFLHAIPTKFEQSNLSSSTESIYKFTPPLSRKREQSSISQNTRNQESTNSSTSAFLHGIPTKFEQSEMQDTPECFGNWTSPTKSFYKQLDSRSAKDLEWSTPTLLRTTNTTSSTKFSKVQAKPVDLENAEKSSVQNKRQINPHQAMDLEWSTPTFSRTTNIPASLTKVKKVQAKPLHIKKAGTVSDEIGTEATESTVAKCRDAHVKPIKKKRRNVSFRNF